MDKARGGFDSLRCALCRIELRKKKSVKLREREREHSQRRIPPSLLCPVSGPTKLLLPPLLSLFAFFFGGGWEEQQQK